MKIIIRIAFLLIVALFIVYYTTDHVKENNLLEAPVKQGSAVPVQDKGIGQVIPQTSRPQSGLSTLIGKSTEELLAEKGEPDRVEPSSFGYDWWIYVGDENFMVGITSGSFVNQLYSSDLESDLSPYEIGQDIDDIYRFTIVESEINIEIDENIYSFTLKSEDLKTRLLILYKELYAQLYIDGSSGKLEGVRFIDPHTLVLHQPYEMTFMGELLVADPPSSTKQVEVDRAAERQLFELTNSYREQHDVPELESDLALNNLAQEHSKSMALESYLTDDEKESPSLSDRLKDGLIEHRKAAENIATNYIDAIEAVHGWHNSAAHRKVLLDESYTSIGLGAYGNVYTQIFILKNDDLDK